MDARLAVYTTDFTASWLRPGSPLRRLAGSSEAIGLRAAKVSHRDWVDGNPVGFVDPDVIEL